MTKRITIVLLLLLAVFPSSCAAPSESGRMRLVVSIQPLAWFAERISGDLAEVSVMVPPGGNPHTYEPLPRQMAMLAQTPLFVKAGSGVEFEIDWMERFMKMNPSLKVCDASRGVALLPMAVGHSHRHDSSVHHMDPHYWLDPGNGLLIADAIAEALSKEDPLNSAVYRENARVLKEELRSWTLLSAEGFGGLPTGAFWCFILHGGTMLTPTISNRLLPKRRGKVLTPRQMERVIRFARQAGIRVCCFTAVQQCTGGNDCSWYRRGDADC